MGRRRRKGRGGREGRGGHDNRHKRYRHWSWGTYYLHSVQNSIYEGTRSLSYFVREEISLWTFLYLQDDQTCGRYSGTSWNILCKSLKCSFLEQLSESCLVEMGKQIGSFRRSRAQPAQLRQRVPIVSDNVDL